MKSVPRQTDGRSKLVCHPLHSVSLKLPEVEFSRLVKLADKLHISLGALVRGMVISALNEEET